MSYTDALFFAAGSATQSGLNPVDLNRISTYQQVGLWFGSMISNPIVIHSFVVFIRLHWFQKRFQHVVQEAKMLRRTRTRTRTRTKSIAVPGGGGGDHDMHRTEMGIRDRNIRVLRDNDGHALGRFIEPNIQKKYVSSGIDSPAEPHGAEGISPGASSGDTDATEAPPGISADGNLTSTTQRGSDHHLALLQNQRRPTQALRIPSPREFDRGGLPEAVDDIGEGLVRRQTTQSDQGRDYAALKQQRSGGQHITIDEPNVPRPPRRTTTFPRVNSRFTADQGTDADEPSPIQRRRTRRGTLSSLFGPSEGARDAPYLSWQPTIGRNSAFVDLTEEQKNELGGIEYRSLKLLAIILVGYFFFFHLLGIVALVPWILHTHWGRYVTEAGVGRPWWAIFIAGSSFNDQGFSLTPDSLLSFNDAIFPLLLMTFTIIIGNTGFPCMLRLIIWMFWKICPRDTAVWEELHFLLDHPRRCFTLLFPGYATWWLFGVLVLLNGTDLILFIILDVSVYRAHRGSIVANYIQQLNDSVISKIPAGIRIVDGLFQSAATRTAGLTVVNLSSLHPAVQVSYMIMMYISVYPIAISLRRTNVYEEKSLGIYYNPADDDVDNNPDKEPSYVAAHLRRQLGYDIWYIFLGLFIIAVVEGRRLVNDPGFSMFAVLFEIVSAYGTVGLSLGYPNTNTSLSAQFKIISKLVIIAMMIRGRHRGLPYQLDRAVLLPSESLREKELEEAALRMKRRNSAFSAMTGASRRMSSVSQREEVDVASGWQRDPSGGAWTMGSPRLPRNNTAARLSTHQEAESPA